MSNLHVQPGAERPATQARHRHRRAQSLLEFALLLPVLLVILLGMIDLGRAFMIGVATQQGAREAVRVAADARLVGSTTDTTVRQRFIAAAYPAMQGCSGSSSTCTDSFGIQWTFTVSPSLASLSDSARENLSGQVTVSASGSLVPFTQFVVQAIGISSFPIRGEARMMML